MAAETGPDTSEVPVKLAYAPGLAAAAPRPKLWHSGMTLSAFFSLHVMGALFPITAASLLYGWRALCLIVVVLGAAWVSFLAWQRVGSLGRQMRLSHTLWLALLLALMLPVHLMTADPPFFEPRVPDKWAIAVGAGVLVVVLAWLLGGAGSGRVHPVLVAYLLLVVLFKQFLVPHWVLQKDHLFLGDVQSTERTQPPPNTGESWTKIKPVVGRDAIYEDPAAEKLSAFTSGQKRPDRSWLSLDGLLRDDMPPLEDLILGGQPGPIGAGSAIAVIVGGLFLLYRGVIDFRIPLLIYMATMVALLVLPVPAIIREVSSGGVGQTQIAWRWLAFRSHEIGPAKAVTFANYESMAGPLLFMAFFLATSPAIRPMTRRARTLYAIVIGVLAATFQLYVGVSFGPYLALLMVSIMTPTLDKWFKPKTLV
jgi:Na+-translocating ferredoxin:NAD+ oxidoreductase RnfD subunit